MHHIREHEMSLQELLPHSRKFSQQPLSIMSTHKNVAEGQGIPIHHYLIFLNHNPIGSYSFIMQEAAIEIINLSLMPESASISIVSQVLNHLISKARMNGKSLFIRACRSSHNTINTLLQHEFVIRHTDSSTHLMERAYLVPTLYTDRLILKPLTCHDFDAFISAFKHYSVIKNFPKKIWPWPCPDAHIKD